MLRSRVVSLIVVGAATVLAVPAAAQKTATPSLSPTPQTQTQTAAPAVAMVYATCRDDTDYFGKPVNYTAVTDAAGNADACDAVRPYCESGNTTIDARGNEDGKCAPAGFGIPFSDDSYSDLSKRVIRPGRDGYKDRRPPECKSGFVVAIRTGRDGCGPKPTCAAGSLVKDADGTGDMCFTPSAVKCAPLVVNGHPVQARSIDHCARLPMPAEFEKPVAALGSREIDMCIPRVGDPAIMPTCEDSTMTQLVRNGDDVCAPLRKQWTSPSCPAGTKLVGQRGMDVCLP